MCARKRPSAEPGVDLHGRCGHAIEVSRTLAVAQLAHVEVAGISIEANDPRPPQEDVSECLLKALAIDNALAVIAVLAAPNVRLKH